MNKERKLKKGVRKFDKLITGVIVGGAIASIFGASRTKRGKKITKNIKESISKTFKNTSKFMGKSVIFVLKPFLKNKSKKHDEK